MLPLLGTVMHDSNIDIHQSKKQRMDWDSLDLNENDSDNNGIASVESKIQNVTNNGKECERNRGKNVNEGEFIQIILFQINVYFAMRL